VKEAGVVEAAVTKVLEKGYRTWDIYKGEGTEVGTRRMGDLIVEEIEKA
jgi:3-isopropylmalate dehydrogenase